VHRPPGLQSCVHVYDAVLLDRQLLGVPCFTLFCARSLAAAGPAYTWVTMFGQMGCYSKGVNNLFILIFYRGEDARQNVVGPFFTSLSS
jgi:hypothetical protein